MLRRESALSNTGKYTAKNMMHFKQHTAHSRVHTYPLVRDGLSGANCAQYPV